ncbi:DNA-3-methyladenine glycosylase I [Rickettsia endosymbiont of Halotydeus destructor]|uniref:DNA-3-methyladenine glycosylase I n=1 Tax=Rickettsia endosymbiont of Halotydeus destructor TaxID=2996754 RepID=UPI003BB0EC7A
MQRCGWAKSELDILYHDLEWGNPVYDDQKLFEFVTLESAQAGLSWTTILKKRENYRKAYDNFDFIKIAQYDDQKKHLLLEDVGIVRNKLKIEASITNAQVFLQIRNEFKSFSNYIWHFTKGEIIYNNFSMLSEILPQTELSLIISKDLKARGFKFFGPVTCYAFLQAIGVVNDHVTACFRFYKLTGEKNDK